MLEKVGEPNPIPAAAAAALEKAQPAAAKALDYLVKESTAWRKDTTAPLVTTAS